MNYFALIVVIAAAAWVAGIGCGTLAAWWGWRGTRRRFVASVILAGSALGLACLGLVSRIAYSQTVNGRGWSLDSRWFFLALLALGVAALAIVLWRRFNPRSLTAPPTLAPTASR